MAFITLALKTHEKFRLSATGWVANNLSAYQGEHALNTGWMQDEEVKELRIPLANTATKLNLYYKFSSNTTSYSTHDSAFLTIGTRQWSMETAYRYTKFSTLLRPHDSVAVIRFKQTEDGYTDFHVDDIRTLRYTDSAQTDRLWDFEDGFYPKEISGDWWIDNSSSYLGDYALRAPKGKDGACGFDIAVADADTVSFWNTCTAATYSTHPAFRIGKATDYVTCPCGPGYRWTECIAPTRGQTTVHIETDCLPGASEERRIDHLRAW
jgi:hypothetical protein